MKKQFAKLSKKEQERVEGSYHDKDPHDFDSTMSRASVRKANSNPASAKLTIRKRKTNLKLQVSK